MGQGSFLRSYPRSGSNSRADRKFLHLLSSLNLEVTKISAATKADIINIPDEFSAHPVVSLTDSLTLIHLIINVLMCNKLFAFRLPP